MEVGVGVGLLEVVTLPVMVSLRVALPVEVGGAVTREEALEEGEGGALKLGEALGGVVREGELEMEGKGECGALGEVLGQGEGVGAVGVGVVAPTSQGWEGVGSGDREGSGAEGEGGGEGEVRGVAVEEAVPGKVGDSERDAVGDALAEAQGEAVPGMVRVAGRLRVRVEVWEAVCVALEVVQWEGEAGRGVGVGGREVLGEGLLQGEGSRVGVRVRE